MRSVDVIVIGAGPAGASAARALKAGGADVLLLDRARFPRAKLCAGWITPEVVAALRPDIDTYPHGLLTFRRLQWHLKGLRLPLPCIQHSIRRWEFDAWLVERSGVELEQHAARQITRDGTDYVIDGRYRCRYLIGAAGTACPVRRALFGAHRRSRALQTATLELEFQCEWRDPDCHLWFFEQGLPGYSWYVPKGGGWLNVGVGAMAGRLKQRGEDVWLHWQRLHGLIARRFGIVMPDEPGGYSYYVRGSLACPQIDQAYLVGDSAGLATRDMCEGIGPAIESGRLAAESILHDAPYELGRLSAASLRPRWLSRWLDWAFTRGDDAPGAPQAEPSALSLLKD